MSAMQSGLLTAFVYPCAPYATSVSDTQKAMYCVAPRRSHQGMQTVQADLHFKHCCIRLAHLVELEHDRERQLAGRLGRNDALW